ncbi:MAG: LysR substrate-binding domain-containing protein, partial [Gordonia sp. (in: high G+C Gram-positive bacteria)]
AIRTSVAGGVGPAVLSNLAVHDVAHSGGLRVIELPELDLTRSLRAVWRSPKQLRGPAADLVRIAQSSLPGRITAADPV